MNILPATNDDIKYHKDDNSNDLLRWITERERVPGRYSSKYATIDPETQGFMIILLIIAGMLALIMSIPTWILISNTGNFAWLHLYWPVALPLLIASPLVYGVINDFVESRKNYESMRRYANSKGYLVEYKTEVDEYHKTGKLTSWQENPEKYAYHKN